MIRKTIYFSKICLIKDNVVKMRVFQQKNSPDSYYPHESKICIFVGNGNQIVIILRKSTALNVSSLTRVGQQQHQG